MTTAVHEPGPTPGAPDAQGGRGSALRGQLRRLRRIGPWLTLLPLAGAVWWVQVFNPTNGKESPLGPCGFHAAFGINGPTCGGTRSFYYLIHGDLIDAVRMHLPFVLAVPFLVYAWLQWALGSVGIRIPALRLRPAWLIAYGIFFMLFTVVLRNIDVGPLAWFDIPNVTPRAW